MKLNAWRRFLEKERDQHGKVLYTVTELAHVASTSRAVLNVELARLRREEVLVQQPKSRGQFPDTHSRE